MAQLTQEGHAVVGDIANRHGFSTGAIEHMLIAVVNGNGSMAQFSHQEFGGSGQWMRGGMIMLGDMFNNNLKGRVDCLCSELSNLIANHPGYVSTGSFQSQNQSSGNNNSQSQGSGGMMGSSSLFAPDPNKNWWTTDLGSPSAVGNQNDMHYAYFPNARRLAVKTGSSIWVYDTLNHQIGGFSQQQGYGNSVTFSSQMGTVSLANLPVVTRDGQAVPPPPPPQVASAPVFHSPAIQTPMAPPSNPPLPPVGNNSSQSSPSNKLANESDIFSSIERLAALQAKGILTNAEFESKKSELLSRL